MRAPSDRRRANGHRGDSHRRSQYCPRTPSRGRAPDRSAAVRARVLAPTGGPVPWEPVSSLRVGPRAFLNLCRFAWPSRCNVVTGAAVRLSDSGLGCPDWPTCAQHHLTPPLSPPPGRRIREPGGRVRPGRHLRRDLRGLVLPATGPPGPPLALRRVDRRSPRRGRPRRLRRLLEAQRLRRHVPLPGGDGPAGRGRRPHPPGRPRPGSGPAVSRPGPALTRAYLVGLTVARPGGRSRHHRGRAPRRRQGGQADPHRPRGHDPHPRRDRAGHRRRAHGHPVAPLSTDAPARIQDVGRLLLAAMVVQGAIGYTQFFTHLPAVLVGFHVVGASIVWSTVLWFHHGLSDHRTRDGRRPYIRAVRRGRPAPSLETARGRRTSPA